MWNSVEYCGVMWNNVDYCGVMWNSVEWGKGGGMSA